MSRACAMFPMTSGFPWQKAAANQRRQWINDSWWQSWLHYPIRINICVRNYQRYVKFVNITVAFSFLLSWLITWCVSRVTRLVLLVEQELLALTERMCSPQLFDEVPFAQSLVFILVFGSPIVCYFVFFHFAIIISVLLFTTQSEHLIL